MRERDCYLSLTRRPRLFSRPRSASRPVTDALLKFREEFPILSTCTYLVSNSLGAMPRGVPGRLQEYADAWRGWRARGGFVPELSRNDIIAIADGMADASRLMEQEA